MAGWQSSNFKLEVWKHLEDDDGGSSEEQERTYGCTELKLWGQGRGRRGDTFRRSEGPWVSEIQTGPTPKLQTCGSGTDTTLINQTNIFSICTMHRSVIDTRILTRRQPYESRLHQDSK